MFEITEDAEAERALKDVWLDFATPTVLLDALGCVPKHAILTLTEGDKPVVVCVRPEGELECALQVETCRGPESSGACLALRLEFYVPTGSGVVLPAFKYFLSLQLSAQASRRTRLMATLEAQGPQLKRKLVQTARDERAEVMRPPLKALLALWKSFAESSRAAPYR
jgi:hypothetical protein